MFLINWQMEGTNSNYRSVKFEEISPKKTGDIHVFRSHNMARHRIGIRQDHYLSMREIPNHAHTRAELDRLHDREPRNRRNFERK